MKIDVFNHVFPRRAFERSLQIAPDLEDMGKRVRSLPVLVDLEARFRMMDEFGDYRQILSLASPPLETFAPPEVSPELARIVNDEMAELVGRHPDRFAGFAASLPMNHPRAAEAELHRAVSQLGACGVQIFSNAAGRPLDAPEFAPLFDAMAACDLPVLLHPARGAAFPDYATETRSRYEIWWTFGWPYETSAAMARLVFSGLFDRHPGIKILAHHMGAMIPYFEGRVGYGWDQLGLRTTGEDYVALRRSMPRRPLEYFRMFYADTALFGARSATRCGLDFFGPGRVLFASDSPFEPSPGVYIRETIAALDSLDLPAADREAIYWRNAAALFRLKVP